MPESELRTHEIAFCSRVAGWLNTLFAAHPEWPFRRAEIEDSRALHRKRSDLRVYGDAHRLILAGEVKLPGTPAVPRKLEDAFAQRCQRDTGPLVEEEFMACHLIARAHKLAPTSISLQSELCHTSTATHLTICNSSCEASHRPTRVDKLPDEPKASGLWVLIPWQAVGVALRLNDFTEPLAFPHAATWPV